MKVRLMKVEGKRVRQMRLMRQLRLMKMQAQFHGRLQNKPQ